jgi:hypothetical protein
MSDEAPATEPTKTAIENSVTYYLSDKITDASTPIAAKKFMTSDNQLIYLTICNVAESTVPRFKVQLLKRVEGGVHETGYQLFADHRFLKYDNDMIFGSAPSGSAGDKMEAVSEVEAEQVLTLVNGLNAARQTL